MGMDVSGVSPVSETGSYIRFNIWWWHPLATYVEEVLPKAIYERCEHWHSNDGDGLGANDSRTLAKLLRVEVNSGRTATYEAAFNAAKEAEEDEACIHCKGIGERVVENDDCTKRSHCNVCDGTGWTKPISTWYGFDTAEVSRFADFLSDCGGFRIC